MLAGAIAVFSRVASAALLSLFERPKRCQLPAARSQHSGAAVFVMLPLDAFSPDCPVDLSVALPRLAAAGVTGIMVDVWWGVCEPEPGVYEFERYNKIAEICRLSGLKMQATICLHACGDNVGDTVNIPLPHWVIEAGDEHGLWYVDRSGFEHHECLGLSADMVSVLPTRPEKVVTGAKTRVDSGKETTAKADDVGADDVDHRLNAASLVGTAVEAEAVYEKTDVAIPAEKQPESAAHAQVAEPDPMRSALEAYRSFIAAFLEAMGPDFIGSTITELQVGCGPCGELRYPSYPLGSGMWEFPGMGEFQCFDTRMLADLAATARSEGHPAEWGAPPGDTGQYNAKPNSSSFFREGFSKPRGAFFLTWYADALLTHGENMMKTASDALAGYSGVALAVKISGIHWWKFTASRAAEATAGYYVSNDYCSYERIAGMLAQYNAVMDFTCLEMRTWDQPFLKARCGPRQLVREVFKAAEGANVRVAGENALERYDKRAYDQIVKAYQGVDPARIHGFTFLRLGPTLLKDEHFEVFEGFVADMQKVGL